MKFEKFKPVSPFNYSSGWDKFALDYVLLPGHNSIYVLTKNLMYEIIDKNITLNEKVHVLDIGCGTGNDFSFFLSRKAKITAFDRSAGMLNKAFENYNKYIDSGKINLLQGRLEDFDDNSLNDEKYDLIFSMTGGLSYINNKQLLNIFNILKSKLKPNGRIITSHFNQFCIAEKLFYLIHLHFKLANQRHGHQIAVNIKEQELIMYLRSTKDLLGLFSGMFNTFKFYPLLAWTPPYQTGYKPLKWLSKIHKKLERNSLNFPAFSKIADQTVMIVQND